ncbi:hypothetical protein GGS23DRAFT_83750 [Durotheca rogersii]|uniref:uncharacterized protein n=1 Tax=Durotheca rogersii TaxID=419775 RepID=UPI00221E5857|nr:uncharacterized protein GGS23DRAFT_83750 [Durotheca rogersii]KAI5862595.1 hypothetical protein GGS23DRAFT_83750 [Durotheca rogersii]
MARRTTAQVPDAWEDEDWEVQADKAAAVPDEERGREPLKAQQLSKAERLAQHAESNRKLWESADAPSPEPPSFHYIASRSEPPLTSTFKPAVTVLSRKPTPSDGRNGGGGGGGEYDDDDADARKNGARLTPEQILAKQQRERDERQRRYDEARAKIFGTSNDGAPTATTPPPRSTDGRGPRGRARGGGRGGGAAAAGYRHNNNYDNGNQRPGPQLGTGGAGAGAGGRELYDPNYSPMPGSHFERRGNSHGRRSPAAAPRDENQAIRAPRGPDGTGRGGFGFARHPGSKDS